MLENTPINVKSIREIGQLITAEYYGEVLNSLQQSRIDQVMEENVVYENEYLAIHTQYQNSIIELIDDIGSFRVSKWNRKNDLYEYFYFRFSSLTDNPYYQNYIEWLLKEMDYKNEKQLLNYFYTNSNKAIEELKSIKEAGLSKEIETISKNRISELSADKKFRKQQIVVLGRGWVKAGIDFGKFTEANFKYDKASKTIHLIGLKPEILSCTINPWFIPEKQVKGFEVILVSQKANQPKYMQIVKEETLKKLRNNAIEANILEQAWKNAEINLRDFFNLLIEDGIDQVIIHEDFFSYFDVSMTLDSLNPRTLISIDSLLVSRFQTDSLEVTVMRDSLKFKRRVHVGDTSYNIQRFSTLLTVIDDEELSAGELAQMESLRERIQTGINLSAQESNKIDFEKTDLNTLDTIWYFPDAKTLGVMSKLLDETIRPDPPFTTWQIITKNSKYVKWDSLRSEKYSRMIQRYIFEQKMADYNAIVEQIKSHVSQLVIHDKTYVASKAEAGEKINDNSIKIDDHTVLYTDTIRKWINSALLFHGQSDISMEEITFLMDSLTGILPIGKPYSFIPIRDSIQKKFVYCLSKDCYPLGRYTYLFANIGNDSLNQTSLSLAEKEEMEIRSDMGSLAISAVVHHIDRMDSIWFFPSQIELGEFTQKTDEVFPAGNITGFFRKTLSPKKFKEWERNRVQFYHNLIFEYILRHKLEELEKVKSAIRNELEYTRKSNTT